MNKCKIGKKPTKEFLEVFTKEYLSKKEHTATIISMYDLVKRKESIAYLRARGLNPNSYKNVVKTVEAFKFIEELEKKYSCKF